MNHKSHRRYDALICIRSFRIQHPEAAAKTAAQAAFDAVDAAIAEVQFLAGGRLQGTNTFLSASAERQAARADLHEFISDLSRIAKILPRALYPDIAAQLKMGRLNAYQDLLTLARNAIVVISPIKQAFIDHGAPETVTEDIQAKIDALELAAARRNRGLGSQIEKNTSLRIAARNAMDQVRILDGILRFTLRNQPGVLAEWKSAMRLRRRGISAQPTAALDAPDPASSPTKSPAQSQQASQSGSPGNPDTANDAQGKPTTPAAPAHLATAHRLGMQPERSSTWAPPAAGIRVLGHLEVASKNRHEKSFD